MTKVLSNKKLQEKIGWKPHKNQKKILDSNKKEVVISAGKAFGKSMLCAYMCLKALLQDDKQILLVAPTYSLNDRVLGHIEKWCRVAGFNDILSGYSKRVPQKWNIPLWGSKLECRSAEAPEGMMGKRFDLVIVDEAAKVSRKVWEKYIYPTTQIKEGKIVYISTPFGQNWFYEIWNRTKGFTFKSIDNPHFKKTEWKKAGEELPEATFQQEYEARFLADAAAVFRGVDNVIGDCLEDVRTGHYYVMGVDLGRHRDFTVMTIIDTLTNKVVFWDRFKTVEYPFQKKRIIANAKRYNHARIIIDSSNIGDPIASDIIRESQCIVDEFKFLGGKSQNKSQLIEKLAIFIEQKQIVIPDNIILIDEIKAYGYELTPAGRVTYGAPQGLHDDCVISLALATWGLTSQKIEKLTFFKKLKIKAEKKIKPRIQYE